MTWYDRPAGKTSVGYMPAGAIQVKLSLLAFSDRGTPAKIHIH